MPHVHAVNAIKFLVRTCLIHLGKLTKRGKSHENQIKTMQKKLFSYQSFFCKHVCSLIVNFIRITPVEIIHGLAPYFLYSKK